MCPVAFPFTPRANSSASLRSCASGLPLFSPPDNRRKLFVFHPAHPNSPMISYPFAFSFSRICAWLLSTNFLSATNAGAPQVEKRKAFFPSASGSRSARSRTGGRMLRCRSPSRSRSGRYARISSGVTCRGVFTGAPSVLATA